MPYASKAFILKNLDEYCFSVALDSLSDNYVENPLSFEALNLELVTAARKGFRTTYNRDFIILSTYINEHEENSVEYAWAVAHLLILLISISDPRLKLMKALADHWAFCMRDDQASDDSGKDLKLEMRKLGLNEKILERCEQEIRTIQRKKSVWYPRARHQINSKEYLRTLLSLHPNEEEHLKQNTKFFVLGTCFAQNIHMTFDKLGLSSTYLSREEEVPAEVQFSMITESETIISDIEQNDACFILTLGFAETKGLKKARFEDIKSGRLSRFATPDSIANKIVDGVRRIKEINRDSRIFLTLSPVPLQGTASSFNVFEANAISKSIVRYAIALATEAEPSIEYFPSYEIVTQVAPAVGEGGFANDDGHPRHVNHRVVDLICSLFIDCYCPWAIK